MEISPPTGRDLFFNKKIQLKCEINSYDKAKVSLKPSWTKGGKTVSSHITHENPKQTENKYTQVSWLTIDVSDWFKGDEIECSIGGKSDKIKYINECKCLWFQTQHFIL